MSAERRGAGLHGGGSPGGPASSKTLPPGIRSWSDGRVPKEATNRYEIVVIGCSMGGMHALQVIFETIPRDFSLPVADVEDKRPIERGRIYLAPPDYHLLIQHGYFSLSVDEHVHHARPSIDVLFESAADAYGERVIGVILTGANQDGAAGLARIKARGGVAVVQDPRTAERHEMPEAALAATHADAVLPLDEIGPFLYGLVVPPAGNRVQT